MSRFKRFSMVLSCAVLMTLVGAFARGDSTPATGTITGTVAGANGPAASISVKLYAAEDATKAPAAAPGEKKHHAPAVAETTTDEKGAFTFANVAVGSYHVVAGAKGTGHGKADAVVTAGGSIAVSITLKEHKKPA